MGEVGTTAAKEQPMAPSMGTARCLWWPGCGTSSFNPYPVCDQVHSHCVLESRATGLILRSHSRESLGCQMLHALSFHPPQEPGFPTSLFILLQPAVF